MASSVIFVLTSFSNHPPFPTYIPTPRPAYLLHAVSVLLFPYVGDAPIKVQRYRKMLVEGHLNISATGLVQTKNSADLERAAATELKSAEFFVCTRRVSEMLDVHTNFTAGQILPPLSEHHPRARHSGPSTPHHRAATPPN